MKKSPKQEQAARLTRIRHYEALLDALRSGDADPEALDAIARALSVYYASDTWKRDFAADEQGLLPKDLRRGVLSEDGIWNVLEAWRESKSQTE